ncbi:MAG: Nif3-like dinuclear metal center hexameric protein [Planctomycetota bacterium]|jgi:dinuclear metal center YbgI/SA1388 family protein|nr:Nif3-like dinuclear metal center hexameric protein [Planctomycetota bacterium]
MSVSPDAIETLTTELLDAEGFPDYGPNGIQVDAAVEVNRLATGTTASLATIAAAVDAGAQALLVHHGIMWGGASPIRGMFGARVRSLITGGVSLLGYHLPLDAHLERGNNAWVLKQLGCGERSPFAVYKGREIGCHAQLAQPVAPGALASQLASLFDHEVIHCPGGSDRIERIGVVTGGGQSLLADAAAAGCQAFITGETSEQTWHEAAELGIHCFACGHHATESKAIHKLGTHVAQQLGIEHIALDESNPL